MRPVRTAVAVALTAAAALTGSFVARSTGHRSATHDRVIAAPAAPTTVAPDPNLNQPGPTPQPKGPDRNGPTNPSLALGRVGPLRAVQAVGTRTAFAVGKGAILTTRDGGRTWVRLWRGAQDLNEVDFVDASTGWALGDGILLGTVDGGQHWRQLGQPSVRPLRSVHFSSRGEGWGVAGRELGERRIPATVLVHTRDGGRTWSVLAAPAPPQSVCFTSANDGWLASRTEVWRSTDGGRSWGVRPSFTLPLTTFTYAPSAVLQCAARGSAWVQFDSGEGAAGTHPYVLYATGDGGASWRAVLGAYGGPGVPSGPGRYPGPFSVIDPARTFLLSPTPAMDVTGAVLIDRGGIQLQRRQSIPRTALAIDTEPMAVSFASAAQGWVVGAGAAGRGVILATFDGGRSWWVQLSS
jgi:photosystem II stability/assembly factor-like uncharacterized protein